MSGNEHDHSPWEDAGSGAYRILEHASGDADGCFVLVLVGMIVFVAIGLLLSMIGLILGAPALLAEVFLDAAVGGILAGQLPAHDLRWWAVGVFRRTWKLVLGMAIFVSIAGGVLQAKYPEIITLGDLFRR